jgi:hypothetical protein
MGFLKRFLRGASTEETVQPISTGSFESLTDEELQTHMAINTYGTFELTEAVRPSYDLQVIPRQGFRHDVFRDEANSGSIPVLMAAASRRHLYDLFIDLLDPLGDVVDVVLETSHRSRSNHDDLYREHIDMPVLKSLLYDYEDLFLNDGCTGVAIINPSKRQEVQLDEHKLLMIYGEPLQAFEKILIRHDVYPDPSIRFITEAEHVHSSSEKHFDMFNVVRTRFGLETENSADVW